MDAKTRLHFARPGVHALGNRFLPCIFALDARGLYTRHVAPSDLAFSSFEGAHKEATSMATACNTAARRALARWSNLQHAEKEFVDGR